MPEQSKNYLLNASKIIYGICLFLPAWAYGTIKPDEWVWGITTFLMGPLGFFAGHFSWFANPFLWSAWHQLRIGNYTAAIVRSALALGLAVTFLFHKTITDGHADFPYVAHIGYYLWILSILLVLVSACLALLKKMEQKDVECA